MSVASKREEEVRKIASLLRLRTRTARELDRAADLLIEGLDAQKTITTLHGRLRDAEERLASVRSMMIGIRERARLLHIENVEAHDAAIVHAARVAKQHDTTPRVKAKDDPLAHANQQGYLTARDQIVEAILKLKAGK